MNRKLFYLVVAGALALAGNARAQEPPPLPEPPTAPDMAGPGAPIGPRMELLGFGEMHPGKVVTGAPYSAVGVRETKQNLADGNSIDNKQQFNVSRDSQGRTRRELPNFRLFGASAQSEPAVMIHDPVARTTYVLHADTKTAEQLPGRHAGANKG